MQRIEYRDTMDKSTWDRGPWDNEPDKIQWQDEATGLPCLAVRNHHGSWCGYVGVSEDHPFYGKYYSGEMTGKISSGNMELPTRNYENSPSSKVSVHGGLTFSDFCHVDVPEDRSICHKVEPGENDKIWWLGFDCGHAFDYTPALHAYMKDAAINKKEFGFSDKGAELVGPLHTTYRDVAYIQAEVANLAKQLKALKDKP